MSLINQMLRDLESRRSGEQLDRSGVVPPVAAATPRGRPTWLPVALLLLLGMAAAIGWRLLDPIPASPIATPVVPKIAAPAAPTVEAAQPVEAEAPLEAKGPLATPTAEQSSPTTETAAAAPQTEVAEVTPDAKPESRTLLRLDAIEPTRLVAGPGYRTLTLSGDGFRDGDRIAVNWPGGGTMLGGERIERDSATRMRLRLRPGILDNRWTLQVVGRDGQRSRPLALEIVAAESESRPAPAAQTTMEKRMRPLSREERAEQRYQQGYRLLQQGESQGAESALDEALALDPAHRAAAESLSALLVSQGRNDEALVLLERVAPSLPESSAVAMLQARLLLGEGEESRAIAALERSRDSDAPQPAELHAMLAGLYQRGGRYDDSIASYRSALQNDPGNGIWLLGLGISQGEAGESGAAIDSLKRALASGDLSTTLADFARGRLQQLRAR